MGDEAARAGTAAGPTAVTATGTGAGTETKSAGEKLGCALGRLVDKDEVDGVLAAQEASLERYRATNAVLEQFNAEVAAAQGKQVKALESYTKLLREMKKDLDNIFKRCRSLRSKLDDKFPLVVAADPNALILDPDDDDEGDLSGEPGEAVGGWC
ncbi:UPF0459 protein C19orf50 [Thecamonas trahens ATCC 50062]|uniref:UPF0459 protein C19orf50 n=1 Tax=Thecamonas trahens ATCC 50062 TaxID=461836 RepID=A0A0L0DHM6_THETB|nr:UPF0459 protein C19orf50 [Thecamonas trahens ATCC 50062]KNC51817.1 UPF0459 protein C19orf50 [Thecamonas trahens ATCC 50062]|eukprot:XP_013755683.1 UPF0459 protein C19orf50 [Thecamonas trahens ATCC 50062]